MTLPVALPGLSAAAFQHPLDLSAIRVLASTPGTDLLTRFISGKLFERLANVEYTGHCIQVDGTQYPSIYRRYLDLAERLDVRRLPDLFVKNAESVNAYAQGVDRYFIVLHTGLLDLLEEAELDAIMAHELGHVKCDHMKYMTMVNFLRDFGPAVMGLLNIPLAPAVLTGAQIALVQWYQKAEFSADRAALLATQDVEGVQCALAKLAGFSPKYTERLDIERIKRQAEDFDDIGADSLVEKALKVWTLLQLTHPVPVIRIREIELWATSPEYRRILRGDYRKAQEPLPAGPMKLCPGCQCAQNADSMFCGNCGTNLRTVPVLGALPVSSPPPEA